MSSDPYQAAQLMQHLSRSGINVVEHPFSVSSVSRLALRLYQLIADHALELPDDPDLLDELANVRLREPSPGVYRLDHTQDRHDDRAVAISLASWWLIDQAASRRVSVVVDPRLAFTGDVWRIDGGAEWFDLGTVNF